MNKILVLEDEPMLSDMIKSYLEGSGFEVTSCDNYEQALDLAYENKFDLFIFDVKIIGGSGFKLLEELRNSGVQTPCIFETSLNGIDDVKTGFDSGCDDYIKKPFELAELKLRVENILKRNFSHIAKNELIKIDDKFTFDMIKKRLLDGDKEVNLAKKESELLVLFLQNKGKILSRDTIYSSIWEYNETPSELSLRVYISNLRKIIGADKIISHSKMGYEYV